MIDRWMHAVLPFSEQTVSGQTGPLAWTLLWQSTVWLALGLLASRICRRRAAQAHLLLVLATVAALLSPVLTTAVRHLEWGILPARQAPAAQGGSVATDLAAAPNIAPLNGPTHRMQADQAGPALLEPALLETGATAPQSSTPPAPVRAPSVAAPISTANAAAVAPSWTARFGNVIPAVVAGCWLIVSLILAVRLVVALGRGGRIARGARDESSPLLLDALREAAGALALQSAPGLRVSPFTRSPMIWCWGARPALLLPDAAAAQRRVNWRSIFCHELAHLVRRDHWSALWMELLVMAVPWQPLAWRCRRRLAFLREQACDDWALAAGGEATDYAESLLHLVPQRSAAYALAAVSSRESLKERLEHVLSGVRVWPAVGRGRLVAASLVALGAVTVVALAQERSTAVEKVAAVERPSTSAPASRGTTSRAAASRGIGEIKLPPSKEQKDDVLVVRGQVLRPDGQPAAGAKIFALRNYHVARVKRLPLATATAGSDGRFEISVRKSQFNDNRGSGIDYTSFVARADGFGMQGTVSSAIDAVKPLVLKLVPDLPIHGRVVDLEGKPVAGVNVRLLSIRTPIAGQDLSPWLEAVKAGTMINGLAYKLGFSLAGQDDESQPPLVTDRDGRFTITGVGAERVASLELRGETIAYRQLDVATRAIEPLTRQLWFYSGLDFPPLKDQVFGADFTFQASPTRIIEGTVRDAATGKPLAGVGVESEHLAGTMSHPHNVLRAETDAQGHYRLVGMPKASGPDLGNRNRITIVPNDNQPYFMRELDVQDPPGIGPIMADIELHRGLWVTGRVTDKATGKPVVAAVSYLPFLDNPFTFNVPGFNRGERRMEGPQLRYMTAADGTYRIPALPGRAIVGVGFPAERSYRMGVGASEIKGQMKSGEFPTYANPAPASPRIYNTLKEISPREGEQSVTCDLTLDPGDRVRITVVDVDGKPVSGCAVQGLSSNGYEPAGGSTFEVSNLGPDERREVAIYHQKRQIGKYFVLKHDEKSSGTMTVRLERCATLVGRLVDEDGVPFKGVELQASPAPGSYPWFFIPIVVSRDDGTFECRGLFPGCDYGLSAHGREVKIQSPFQKIVIEPGKTIQLGDVKLKRRPA